MACKNQLPYFSIDKQSNDTSVAISPKKRGLFIVIEGLDRCGKSTQAKMLVDAMIKANKQTELWKYPNRTTATGQLIDKYLRKEIEMDDHAIHLLFSANRWETVDLLIKTLNAGINIVADRYAYSGVAYTAAKTDFDIEWCKQCDVGLPNPDMVFFLDTPVLADRAGFGTERYETENFQAKVREKFIILFGRFVKNEWNMMHKCIIINAKDKIEEIHAQIFAYTTTKVCQFAGQLLGKIEPLWGDQV